MAEIQGHGVHRAYTLVVFIYMGTFSFFSDATLLCSMEPSLSYKHLYEDAYPNPANQSTSSLPGIVIGPRRTNQNLSLTCARFFFFFLSPWSCYIISKKPSL